MSLHRIRESGGGDPPPSLAEKIQMQGAGLTVRFFYTTLEAVVPIEVNIHKEVNTQTEVAPVREDSSQMDLSAEIVAEITR